MVDKIIDKLDEYRYTGDVDMGPSIPKAWFERLAIEIAALYTEPVSEEVERLKKNVEIWKTIAKKRGKRLFKYEKNYATLDGDLPNKQ